MATITFDIDATLLVEAYRKGFELGFMTAMDDSELIEELDNKGISYGDKDESNTK